MPIHHSTGAKDYPLIGDVATLVYLAQVASLELHVPQWRFDADGGRGNPDRLVLDLDPGPGVGLAGVRRGRALGARHPARHGARAATRVTSGSKGIHLYAALPARSRASRSPPSPASSPARSRPITPTSS